MKLLAFDTSTKYLSIACLEDREEIAVFHEDVGIKHSEVLVPTIDGLLKRAKWSVNDLDLVAVGLGPGSFTGLRIAVATVKGFAAALGVKVIGIPTMDAIALNYTSDGRRATSDGFIAPLLDARKDKVYSCFYALSQKGIERRSEYLLVTIDELLDSLDKETVFFGDAVPKYAGKLDAHAFSRYDENIDWYPRAAGIGLLAFERSAEGADDAEELEPLYLHAKECNISKGKSFGDRSGGSK